MANVTTFVRLPPRWTQQQWAQDPPCAGETRLFFAPNAERPQARARREAKARKICERCPVLIECRTFARTHLEYGFWGGESEEERAIAGHSVPNPIGGRSSGHAERKSRGAAPRHEVAAR